MDTIQNILITVIAALSLMHFVWHTRVDLEDPDEEDDGEDESYSR